MDVWFRWARKQATCNWCNKKVERKEPEVVCKMWSKGDPNSRRLNFYRYYHPKCYLEQGMNYLRDHPFTDVNEGQKKGRPFLELNVEKHEHRVKLLKRKASLDQRKRNLKAANLADFALKEALLDTEIYKLVLEIKDFGGVPEKWKKELAEKGMTV